MAGSSARWSGTDGAGQARQHASSRRVQVNSAEQGLQNSSAVVSSRARAALVQCSLNQHSPNLVRSTASTGRGTLSIGDHGHDEDT
jgi:hypothetical protein